MLRMVLLFLNVVIARGGNSSLSFVIDESGSMNEEIEQVRQGARGIMDIILNYKSSQIEDIVLVTFNDPVYLNQMRIKTRDPDKLQAALNAIEAYNYQNRDWEEFSLSGIELALQNSQPNSYVFVFTDASAKDLEKMELIKSMCQKAQTQIVFILTDYCIDSYDRKCIVYQEIAQACSGQMFIVDKDDIYKVIEYIKETVKGEKSILTTSTIPAYQERKVQFDIDDKSEYVLICASGENIRVTSKGGPSLSYKSILSTSNIEALRLDHPTPGKYWITVHGTSQVLVHVFSRTDFLFEHGFSKLIPKSVSDASKQPIAGSPSYLSIEVTDPDHEVQIKNVKITDMDGKLLEDLPLKRISGDFYITEQFISPDKLFQIAVTGKVLKTNRDIQRFSKTPIEPQKPEIIPIKEKALIMRIKGSNTQVPFKGTLQLSCAVSGYPAPTIIWKDSDGDILPSTSSAVELPYDYISYVTLTNVRTSGKSYTCAASNKLSRVQITVTVTVTSPFTVLEAPPGISNARFNEEIVIKCNIASIMRKRIDWFREVNGHLTQIASSDKYRISSGGTELKIKPVTLNSAGQYMCRAVLVEDPSQYKELKTNVKVTVDDKAPVTSITGGPNVEVVYNGTLQLTCTVIGYPASYIIWKDSRGKVLPSTSSHVSIPYVSKNDLTIHNILSGTSYNCIASNKVSSHQSVVQVTVQSPYTVGVPAHSTARYGKQSTLQCLISSTSRMRIDWFRKINSESVPIKASDKYSISPDGTELTIKSVSLDSAGQYTCKAVLVDDPSQRIEYTTDVTVAVDDKAPVASVDEGTRVQVPYNGTLELTCTVTAYPAPDIIWKDASGVILSSKASTMELPYKYKSDLTIHNVVSAGTGYYCVASNKVSSHRTLIQVTVQSPYSIGSALPAHSTARYGKQSTLQCLISSTSRMRIDWFRKINSESVPIKASDRYSISPDGTELTIKSVSLDSAGQYTCKAVLVDDPSQRIEYTTDVTVAVDDKAPVASIDEGTRVQVPYNGTLELTCTVTAYPAPDIRWIDDHGRLLKSESSPLELPYKYTSHLTITNVKTNGTTYVCNASNKLSTENSAVSAMLLSPFTYAVVPPAKTTALYGKEASIHCDIKSASQMHIKWFRKLNKNVLQINNSDDIYSMSADQRELRIKSVTLDETGQYICQAILINDRDQHMEFTTDVSITDLAVPELEKTVSSITTKANNPVTITCKILKGNPRPTLTWVFKSRETDKVVSLTNVEERVTLTSAALTDAGTYQCIAVNAIGGDTHYIGLIVEASPTILLETGGYTQYTAVEGDYVLRIPCNAIGYPKPDISWTRKNKTLLPDDKIGFENETLIIKNPVSTDTGAYECQAINKFGQTTQLFEVIITPYLDSDSSFGDMHQIYILEKESKDIKCMLANSSTDNVRWYLNGLEENVTGTFYPIKDAKQSNDGNYTCRANTPLGSDSDTYEVDVGYAPTFKYDVTNILDWSGEEGNLLDCRVNAKPSAKTKWLYQGKAIEDATRSQLHLINWGKHVCEVSNPHGTISRTFEVTSSACLIDIGLFKNSNIPLVLTEKLSWPEFETTKGTYIIESGFNIRLSCHNKQFQRFPALSDIVATCDHHHTFIVDHTSFTFSDFLCAEEVASVIIKTGDTCLNENSELIQVGFNLNRFVEAYKVCYDKENGVPLYAQVQMSRMNRLASVAAHGWFKYPGIGDGRAEQKYTCGEKSECCYSKSQLINARDVGYGPPQQSTFIDHLNSITLWHPCDSKNTTWSSLENLARSKYEEQTTFTVWSGASTYFTNNGTTAPRYLWKVMRFDGEPLAVVYINDQYPQRSDVLCDDLCANNDLPGLGIFTDDHTYCCEMEEFSRAFGINGEVFNEE